MKSDNVRPEDLEWTCFECGRPLDVGPIKAEYMGSEFTTELPRCPECGFVMVAEEVAMGKMAEVEQLLEDK